MNGRRGEGGRQELGEGEGEGNEVVKAETKRDKLLNMLRKQN